MRAVPTPREALKGYLLAVSDAAWASLAPELRLAAACEAVQCVVAGKGETQTQAAAALVRALADIGRAAAPEPDAVRARAAAALDALCEALARELARQRGAGRVRAIVAQYAVAARGAAEAGRKLDLAATALYDLLVEGERQSNAAPDLPVRLLLLDASLEGAAEHRAHPAADRLIRAGGLLLRYLRRDTGTAAFPEFVQDAAGKLARGEQLQDPIARLALGLEGIAEALAARAVARGAD